MIEISSGAFYLLLVMPPLILAAAVCSKRHGQAERQNANEDAEAGQRREGKGIVTGGIFQCEAAHPSCDPSPARAAQSARL